MLTANQKMAKTDASEENKNSNTENASVDKDSTSGKTEPADSDTSADSKNEGAEKDLPEEDLPEEDIDEEYASYVSSTSTDIVTEYDPETAVGTIRVAKKDSDDPTETEEVTGMTVSAERQKSRKMPMETSRIWQFLQLLMRLKTDFL